MASFGPSFKSSHGLAIRIGRYFGHIKGKLRQQDINEAQEKSKSALNTWEREPEPPTITGLALFLGFNSRKQFEAFERKKKFGPVLKRGRLLIEAEYEKKLHQQPASGAIFALKSMGWNEQSEVKTAKKDENLKVVVMDTGPATAASEKDVLL